MKRNEIQELSNIKDIAIVGGATASSFELTQRKAKVFASSSLVPDKFKNNIPDCIIALEMAVRMDANPLMVMQNLYIVKGKPSWSAQFLISCLNTSGRFKPLKFQFVGERGKDNWGCYAYTSEKGSDEILKGATITIEMAKAEGWYSKKDRNGNEISKWQTMPEQMLMYRAASFFVRVYAPEIANGMYTKEEIEDGVFEVIEPEDEAEKLANSEKFEVKKNDKDKNNSKKDKKSEKKSEADNEEKHKKTEKIDTETGEVLESEIPEDIPEELR